MKEKGGTVTRGVHDYPRHASTASNSGGDTRIDKESALDLWEWAVVEEDGDVATVDTGRSDGVALMKFSIPKGVGNVFRFDQNKQIIPGVFEESQEARLGARFPADMMSNQDLADEVDAGSEKREAAAEAERTKTKEEAEHDKDEDEDEDGEEEEDDDEL
jgi:hypothetical protein